MKANKLLKQYSVTKAALAKKICYTRVGVTKALKNKKRDYLLSSALLRMLLEKRGVDLEKLLESLGKD